MGRGAARAPGAPLPASRGGVCQSCCKRCLLGKKPLKPETPSTLRASCLSLLTKKRPCSCGIWPETCSHHKGPVQPAATRWGGDVETPPPTTTTCSQHHSPKRIRPSRHVSWRQPDSTNCGTLPLKSEEAYRDVTQGGRNKLQNGISDQSPKC